MSPKPYATPAETLPQTNTTTATKETPAGGTPIPQNGTQPQTATLPYGATPTVGATGLDQQAPRSLSFHVAGNPATQGSKRHVGGGRMIEMDKKLPAWRAAVVDAAFRAAGPGRVALDGALSCELTVFLPRPAKSRFGEYPAGPPDLDKLCRAVGDALTVAGVIADDARIVSWVARKCWAVDGATGAEVTITEITPR